MILLCFIIFCFIGSDPANGSSCQCLKDLIRCGRNMTFTSCPDPCPLTCDSPVRTGPVCTRLCVKEGCQCKKGFVLNANGKCVKLQDCPNNRCGPNMIFTSCPNPCPLTCDFPGGTGVCNKACVKGGCQCEEGFFLTDDGRCVALQDCPGAQTCSANETFAFCNVPCPNNDCPTVDTTAIIACSPPFPCKSGCSCKANFLRPSSGSDRCISATDCSPVPCRGPNMVFNGCPPPCFKERCSDLTSPNQCDSRFFNCNPRCVCNPGFLLNDSDVCVPEKQCFPAICGVNEEPTDCINTCPPRICESLFTKFNCSGNSSCVAGCDCKNGFLRNSDGVCVLGSQCFSTPTLQCGFNEEPSDCRVTCPPQTCDSIFTSFNCTGNDICESGCDCLNGFLRNESGICVPSEQCFGDPSLECGVNEKPSDCRVTCPPQTCDSIFTLFNCTGQDFCESGCDCLPGFLRNDNGICVRSEECFLEPKCNIPPECRPTCAVPNPRGCRLLPPSETNQDGCRCQEGFVLSDTNGTCIEIEQCPTNLGCNGDRNAVIKRNPLPRPCQSTCQAPNAFPCKVKGKPVDCECLPGFILNKFGRCIKPDRCNGGNPCGENGTFVPCRTLCENNFCPQNDDRIFPICETFPFSHCFSGCICKLNHRFISRDSQKCIRSDTCPPIPCNRPFERYNSCPSDCDSGFCEEVDQPPTVCNTLVLNCNPQCTCIDDFFRDPSTDICVSAEDCRVINAENQFQ